MEEGTSRLAFGLSALWFRMRDWLTPPAQVISEAGIQTGDRVLDYGCGPGSHTIAVARLVGPSGKVYAADINPMALQHVQRVAARKGLSNIQTIATSCATGLQSSTVDVVFLYDTYHDMADGADVMQELHRVLKAGGTLSFSDHHLKEEQMLSEVAAGGLFRLSQKGRKTYHFVKEG